MGIIETLQAEIQSLKERVTALEQRTKGNDTPASAPRELTRDDGIFRTTPERKEAARARVQAQRQKTRDDIIEMAERDIEALKTSHYPTREKYYVACNLSYTPACDAEFIINRDKRTVVCLLRKRYEKTRVVSRGIAKCHPDDCFNAHIGRAIALRRALGLEVPEAYLNAPQPTEVRVGDVVESRLLKEPERYTVVGTNEEVDEKPNRCHIKSLVVKNFPVKTKIIDDTREEV